MLSSSPWDQSLGPRTGGSPSVLEFPPNRIVGPADSEFMNSAKTSRSNPNMALSLVFAGGDREIERRS